MTKEQIKEMMEKTGQKIIAEDEYHIQYENIMDFGDICFEFDENGKFCQIYAA